MVSEDVRIIHRVLSGGVYFTGTTTPVRRVGTYIALRLGRQPHSARRPVRRTYLPNTCKNAQTTSQSETAGKSYVVVKCKKKKFFKITSVTRVLGLLIFVWYYYFFLFFYINMFYRRMNVCRGKRHCRAFGN